KLSHKAIVDGWKRALGIEIQEIPREALPIHLDFEVSRRSSSEEILKIVKAIVAQDTERYPNGDASGMATGPKYFRDQWYQIGDRPLTLQTLSRWERRAKGFKTGEKAKLGEKVIVDGWKRALGVEIQEIPREALPIHLDFQVSGAPRSEEILKIIQAIVAQDTERYPNGDASGMATSHKYFSDQWYQIGDRPPLPLSTLAGWERRARGLKTGDFKKLSDKAIIDGWKRALGAREITREALLIHLDF